MKKSALVIGTASVLASLGLYLTLFVYAPEPPLAATQKHLRSGNDSSSASEDQIASLQGEVRRLRAEVTVKDEMVRMMAQSAPPEQEPDSAPASAQTPPVDPITQVCTALDEKITTASSDTADARAMKRALEEVVDASVLGSTQVTSLRCSETLCKLTLAGENDATVGASAASMAERTPKMFAASRAYPTQTGETAVYLAKAEQDLTVDEATEVTE